MPSIYTKKNDPTVSILSNLTKCLFFSFLIQSKVCYPEGNHALCPIQCPVVCYKKPMDDAQHAKELMQGCSLRHTRLLTYLLPSACSNNVLHRNESTCHEKQNKRTHSLIYCGSSSIYTVAILPK